MSVRILTGDCRAVLASLPAESVHCVVTSPPYWGQRNYGVDDSVWGGAADCAHDWGAPLHDDSRARRGRRSGLLDGGEGQIAACRFVASSAFCSRCNAWRGALGLEPSPDGTPAKNPQRLGPLTFETRLRALDQVLAMQAACNEAAGRLDRPTIDILNDEEEARIRALIAAETWPDGWDGDEPTGDVPLDAIYADGSVQPLLLP